MAFGSSGLMLVWRAITALFAVLVSGVLLNQMDAPMPKYHLVFTSSAGKFIEVTTDKDGKFRVDLAPGTYRLQIGFDGTVGSITVDKSTSKLKVQRRALAPAPVIEVPVPTRGIIRGDFTLPLGPRA
jgi:carboxypeptidase family protein